MNAEQLRDQLLEARAGASEPMSTTQARLAVTEYCRRRGRSVVAEEVYPALVILARRGAHWELTRRHVRRPAAG